MNGMKIKPTVKLFFLLSFFVVSVVRQLSRVARLRIGGRRLAVVRSRPRFGNRAESSEGN
jgi:hypothetical protein